MPRIQKDRTDTSAIGIIMNALKISQKDNTATLLCKVLKGKEVSIVDGKEIRRIKANCDIEFGHKIATRDIAVGEKIIKYGEIIGIATDAIPKGNHVHTQNVKSLRAGGWKAQDSQKLPSLEDEEFVEEACKSLPQKFKDITFLGYPRKDGSYGTRNLVAVISCVVCSNEAVSKICDNEINVCKFTHQQGCSQTMPDIKKIKEILINLSLNPNVGAVLYVSLGCESVPSEELAIEAKSLSGKPVNFLCLQKEGGLSNTVKKGKAIVRELSKQIQAARLPCPLSGIKLGLKCGSSDTTQGLSANVVAGNITDIITGCGGSAVMGETTEFMGAEHIAASHCKNQECASYIVKKVKEMEKRAMAVGVDMRGGQPTRGNIAGGLTTIEEKSLGALAKAGTSYFCEGIEYGERTETKGLIFMDSPGREPEMLTGLAASGCNLILFTTGRGAPQGFPFVPVVKITGNQSTWLNMKEHIDFAVTGIMDGKESPEISSENLMKELIDYASGKETKAEKSSYNDSMNIYVTGPTI